MGGEHNKRIVQAAGNQKQKVWFVFDVTLNDTFLLKVRKEVSFVMSAQGDASTQGRAPSPPPPQILLCFYNL